MPDQLEEASTLTAAALTLQRLLFALLELFVARRAQGQLAIVEDDLVRRRRARLRGDCCPLQDRLELEPPPNPMPDAHGPIAVAGASWALGSPHMACKSYVYVCVCMFAHAYTYKYE